MLLELYVFPALFAIVFWWASTALIIYLDGQAKRTFPVTFAGATVLMVVGLMGLAATKNDTSVLGAYLAFTFGTLAWGWQETSFYLGYVTGPRRAPCPEGCGGLKHFWHAVETSLYHEIAVIVSAIVVVGLTWGGANYVGLWTFLILWWMHQSAKLNVFFGVRNLGEEFLPAALTFLRSFLTKKSMNLFFPISVTVSTVIAAVLWQVALQPTASDFDKIGLTFLGLLMALAILEHWLLVLPLPASLWSVVVRSRKTVTPVSVDVIAGFLGAGKTTYLRRVLADADPSVRTMVLVNDFGAVGVDGALLEGRGADVVELPNGCICCSLRGDLTRQLRQVVTQYAPQRVLIEPSGVAEVAELLRVLLQPSMKDIVGDVTVTTLIDGARFLADYASMPLYFEAQGRISPLFIVNKTDCVGESHLTVVEDTLRALNPRATILRAVYGVIVDGVAPRPLLDSSRLSDLPDDHEETAGAPQYVGWNALLDGLYDAAALRATLAAVVAGEFGDVRRLKGIARTPDGWVYFDVAGGESHLRAYAPTGRESPRVMAIGPFLDPERLEAAFRQCHVTTVSPDALVSSPASGA